MAYIKNSKERNFYFHLLSSVSQVGEISNLVIVNAHIFNDISPEEIKTKIDRLKITLDIFYEKYKEEYKNVEFSMEH